MSLWDFLFLQYAHKPFNNHQSECEMAPDFLLADLLLIDDDKDHENYYSVFYLK